MSITLVTPEDAPLAVFGGKVSERLAQILEANGILTITSAHCETPAPGELTSIRASRTLSRGADRGAAEPVRTVDARRAEGVAGRIHPDRRVLPGPRRSERVYAAGDATDFPVKHGGIAAQQAVTAAHRIAALAGVGVELEPFQPVITGCCSASISRCT